MTRSPENPKVDVKKSGNGLIPLKISLIYAMAGALWILVSDEVLSHLVKEPAAMTRLEIFKGWAFIAMTATLLYLLVKRHIAKVGRATRALRDNEDRLRMLIERVTDYEIFMIDATGHILSWNAGAELSEGYGPEEVIGKHHSIFFTEEDRIRGLPELELKMAAEKGRFEDEGWRIRKDGSYLWADVVTTAIWDEERNLRGFSKVIRDITDRKIAGEKLRESEERYRVIAETASDAIITIDGEDRIVFANAAMTRIFGYSVDDILGRELTVLMPERMRERHIAAMKAFGTKGEGGLRAEPVELPGLHKDGHEIPLEISYGVFKREGEYFFTGIVRDITERREAAKEEEYKVMLEGFTREIETLVSERTMSLMALKLADGVRTPASIIGWTGNRMLRRDGLSDKFREDVGTIIGEAGKLETIVRNFHSLLTSRKPVFSYEDIHVIVREVLPLIEGEAEGKKQSLRVHLFGRPLKVNAQKNLLRMAVFNMLKNAVEATGEGGLITVATEEIEEKVVLTISDSSRGIPREDIDRIFDPLARRTHGFGMGMPLIKQIIREHMGDIEVTSEVGKGTTVRVWLPVRWGDIHSGEVGIVAG